MLDALSFVGPTGVQLSDFCCSSVSVLVFLSSINFVSSKCWFICLSFFYALMSCESQQRLGRGLLERKTGLSPSLLSLLTVLRRCFCCGLLFSLSLLVLFLLEPPHDKTNKMTARPVWSESSLCAQWVAKKLRFLHADSEDSDQTMRMPRLIWVFAGRTCHFVGFVMRRLVCFRLLVRFV